LALNSVDLVFLDGMGIAGGQEVEPRVPASVTQEKG
jgi:hypothetical protein